MKLIGSKGETSKLWLQLDNLKHLYFEPGSSIVFEQSFENVGDILKLNIGQDGSGVAPHWYLNKVKFLKFFKNFE